MKYQNKSNGVIAELVQENTKFKTVDLIKENGTQTTISQSTFKRWWKAIPEEETAEEEVTKFVEASQTITKELNKNNSKSLVEMVEAQAKKEPKKTKAEKKPKKVPVKKTESVDVEELVSYITDEVEKVSGKFVRKNIVGNGTFVDCSFPGSNLIKIRVCVQKESLQVHTKEKYISKEVKKLMNVTRETFNCKVKVKELNDDTKNFISKLINDILKNTKKEEN